MAVRFYDRIDDARIRFSVIIAQENRKWLFCKHKERETLEFPGGHREPGETPGETARRELWEETGLIAHRLELFGIFSGPEMHYVYPNGDEVSNVDLVFLCRDYGGTLRAQPGEVEELRFFAPNELPERLSPPIVKPVRQWAQSKLEQNRQFESPS